VNRIRPQSLIFAAWTVQLAAWLLPALNVLDSSVRGWETFLISLSVFWPGKDVAYGAWYAPILMGLSAITTLFFVVGSPFVVFRGSRSTRYVSAWVACVAFLVNAHWYIFGEIQSAVSKLRIGYFFWWLSFVVLALGLFGLAGQNDTELIPSRDNLLPEGTS
jgi:hypothetical protein